MTNSPSDHSILSIGNSRHLMDIVRNVEKGMAPPSRLSSLFLIRCRSGNIGEICGRESIVEIGIRGFREAVPGPALLGLFHYSNYHAHGRVTVKHTPITRAGPSQEYVWPNGWKAEINTEDNYNGDFLLHLYHTRVIASLFHYISIKRGHPISDSTSIDLFGTALLPYAARAKYMENRYGSDVTFKGADRVDRIPYGILGSR